MNWQTYTKIRDTIDRFFDLADRFQPRLSDLDQAGDRQVPLAFVEHVRGRAKDGDTALPTHCPP